MSAAPTAVDTTELAALREEWSGRWPEALALWSPFTRLRDPRFCLTPDDEADAGLTGSFAMIRLVDQAVVVSLRQSVDQRLQVFPLEILGHEIGHHILCPADLSDNARMLARMRRALPTVEDQAPFLANLYADLLINDRLQRARGLDMAGVYRTLGGDDDPLWRFYLRTYEVLWALPRGDLTPARTDDRVEGDAVLASRLLRSYAGRWLDGCGRFAALCLPYLMEARDRQEARLSRLWRDAVAAGAGGFPDGLTEIDGDEAGGAIHPSLDPELNGTAGTSDADRRGRAAAPPAEGTATGSPGQCREPFEYGEILAASGVRLDEHEVAIRYYRERAAGNLVPFPTRITPVATDPLPEGLEPWDVGSPLADIDWTATVARSPVVIPGITTVRREWGTSVGTDPARVPVDLDLYVDSSGSMPDPRVTVSYLTLAGAIVALSALRAGARVQATLWSGTQQFLTTDGFIRDEHEVLRVLTGFFGGGTAFPIHLLRDTFAGRAEGGGGGGPDQRPAHVLIVSDDGVTTMFDDDERGGDGREVTNHALRLAGGGGTMVLNLWGELTKDARLVQAQGDGWDIHVVHDWPDLVGFARAFSRRRYDRVPAGTR